MTDECKTAVKVMDLRTRGGQTVYRLSEPIDYSPLRSPTEFIVCSTFEQQWGVFEGKRLTTVNPCDDTGIVLGFDNLVTFGPDDAISTHRDALALLGFELVQEDEDEGSI